MLSAKEPPPQSSLQVRCSCGIMVANAGCLPQHMQGAKHLKRITAQLQSKSSVFPKEVEEQVAKIIQDEAGKEVTLVNLIPVYKKLHGKELEYSGKLKCCMEKVAGVKVCEGGKAVTWVGTGEEYKRILMKDPQKAPPQTTPNEIEKKDVSRLTFLPDTPENREKSALKDELDGIDLDHSTIQGNESLNGNAKVVLSLPKIIAAPGGTHEGRGIDVANDDSVSGFKDSLTGVVRERWDSRSKEDRSKDVSSAEASSFTSYLCRTQDFGSRSESAGATSTLYSSSKGSLDEEKSSKDITNEVAKPDESNGKIQQIDIQEPTGSLNADPPPPKELGTLEQSANATSPGQINSVQQLKSNWG